MNEDTKYKIREIFLLPILLVLVFFMLFLDWATGDAEFKKHWRRFYE